MSTQCLDRQTAERNVSSGNFARRHVIVPRTDVYETADALVLLCDLPGIKEENICVTIEQDVLTVAAHSDSEAPAGYRLAHAEYRPGAYRRVFTLNTEVQRDKVEATSKDGVLRLVLPKAAPATTHKIRVRAG